MLTRKYILKLFVMAVMAPAVMACGDEDEPLPPSPYTPSTPSEGGNDNSGVIDPTASAAGYAMTENKPIFSFVGQNRYSYCPSLIKNADGTTDMYFCGNPQQDVMVDNVYHLVVDKDGSHSTALSVLQPGAKGCWDEQHNCDPSVIKGKFKMDGHEYSYAMFYTGCMIDLYYNEVGLAFADTPDARKWVKYPKQIVGKTWKSEGDLEYAPGANCWGVGQPSAVSLDKAGKVLLTYTCGDLSGTDLFLRELDLSDMSSPVIGDPIKVSKLGITDSNGSSTDFINNADIAVEPSSATLVMIRNLHPNPSTYPAYIESEQDICSMPLADFCQGVGRWTSLYRLTPQNTGFPRNHNSGISRDEYGHLPDLDTLELYYTVSNESPDVSASPGHHAEWTYAIRRAVIARKQ